MYAAACGARYGYSFGTASADVWHNVDYEAMLYPGYSTFGALAFNIRLHMRQGGSRRCRSLDKETIASLCATTTVSPQCPEPEHVG